MVTKKRVSLVPESKVISTPVMYDIEIEGMAALLMNKIPDLAEAKGKSRDQARKDRFEIEKETWREKLHTDSDGQVVIPRINLWKSMIAGARAWGEKIKGGGGKKQYSTIMPDALIVMTDMGLGIHKDDEKASSPSPRHATGIRPPGNGRWCRRFGRVFRSGEESFASAWRMRC